VVGGRGGGGRVDEGVGKRNSFSLLKIPRKSLNDTLSKDFRHIWNVTSPRLLLPHPLKWQARE